ncbi:MAG TPA: hypothetical protein IAC31_05130 [Candidatus Faecousia intestinigallinarum]|nr:hypothetical protein [Candidatus Faecousia intestinigallinarum]
MNQQAMPISLSNRILKQYALSAGIFLLVGFMMLFFRSWRYGVGLLGSAYLLYLARHTTRRWRQGKILTQRVVVLKASRLSRQRTIALVQIEGTAAPEQDTKRYYIPGTPQALAAFSPGTILSIYFDQDAPTELLAWSEVGIR